jgi:hypothetical protein
MSGMLSTIGEAEARASRWDDADWWPIKLQQGADGEGEARIGT